jgi:hypothetical protein
LKRLRGAWKRMRPPTASALLGSALRMLRFCVLQQCCICACFASLQYLFLVQRLMREQCGYLLLQ